MSRFLRQAVLLGWTMIAMSKGGMGPTIATPMANYKDKETCESARRWLVEVLEEKRVSPCHETADIIITVPESPEFQQVVRP